MRRVLGSQAMPDERHAHGAGDHFPVVVRPRRSATSGDLFSYRPRRFRYPNAIGPGVYDIHSPRVPSEQEIHDRIQEMLAFLKPEQLWIDPDCGLKTRQWKETKAALVNMVNAAKSFRAQYVK